MSEYQIGALAKAQLSKGDIEELIGAPIVDEQSSFLFIVGVSTIHRPFPNRLFFVEKCTDEILAVLKSDIFSKSLLIASPEFSGRLTTPHIIAHNPRGLYSRLVYKLFGYMSDEWNELAPHHLFKGSSVSPASYISKSAKIGQGCVIFPGVYIGPNCQIGNNVLIKSNTVIGQAGFGIYSDEDGNNQHLPHVGGVIIKDNVEIGALNTIVAGTIHPTVIEAYVKTDDHVHIAHNCQIGENTLITAHAELSGSIVVGKNVWIGPNVSIVNGISIGDGAFLGIGGSVWKSVPAGERILGLPAKKKEIT